MKNTLSHSFLFANNYRTMTSGVSRDTILQVIRPGAGFKTGHYFVKEKLGAGYRGTTRY